MINAKTEPFMASITRRYSPRQSKLWASSWKQPRNEMANRVSGVARIHAKKENLATSALARTRISESRRRDT
jgi:hypothetical protein